MFSDCITLIKEWCGLKSDLCGKESKVIFKQGDIWWCSLGMNLGEEVFGKGEKFRRPVLVFRKFTGNSFLGLPITRQEKKGSWYVEITIHGEKRWIMLNQARVLDKKRLTSRIGALDSTDFNKVKSKFLEFYNSQKSSSRHCWRESVGKSQIIF